MSFRSQTKARGCWLPIFMTFWEPLRDLNIIPAPLPESGSSEAPGAQANCLNKTMEDRHLPRAPGSKRRWGQETRAAGSVPTLCLAVSTIPFPDMLYLHRLSAACTHMHTHAHTNTYVLVRAHTHVHTQTHR